MTLTELGVKYGTDKVGNYTGLYDRLLGHRRESLRSVMEVGIRQGASLRMWEEYFPNAKILGLDIDPATLFHTERIATAVCDQRNPSELLRYAWNDVDLIVDDGDHSPECQIRTARTLMPRLAKGGIYIIEDVNRLDQVSRAIPYEHVVIGAEPHVVATTGRAIIIFNG